MLAHYLLTVRLPFLYQSLDATRELDTWPDLDCLLEFAGTRMLDMVVEQGQEAESNFGGALRIQLVEHSHHLLKPLGNNPLVGKN